MTQNDTDTWDDYGDGYDEDGLYLDDEDQDWESRHPEYDFEDYEGDYEDASPAWEDMPLTYRIPANVSYWWIVHVRSPWFDFLVKHRLDRCPGCGKIYRFSGDHSDCPIPF